MKRKKKLSFDPHAFLAKVNGGQSVSYYKKNKIVFAQGSPADVVFYIQKGKVNRRSLPAGEGSGDRNSGGGRFLWRRLPGRTAKTSIVSDRITECVIALISKSEINRVIHQEPSFAELFISHLLARNIRAEEDLVDQLFNSSEKRLARTLLLLANFGKEGEPEPILAKISQETLADMIGTTRSRVSAFMNKFRQLGLIEYNGNIEVHRSLLNVVLHEKPQIKT